MLRQRVHGSWVQGGGVKTYCLIKVYKGLPDRGHRKWNSLILSVIRMEHNSPIQCRTGFFFPRLFDCFSLFIWCKNKFIRSLGDTNLMFTSVLIKEIIYSLVVLVHNIFLTLKEKCLRVALWYQSMLLYISGSTLPNLGTLAKKKKKKVLEHHQTVERPRKGTLGNLVWVPYTFIAFQGYWRHFVGGSKLLGRAQTKCTVKPSGKRRKIDARW